MDRRSALERVQLSPAERLLMLETSSDYQQTALENFKQGVNRRLDRLEQQRDQDQLLSTGSIIKILLAVALPILMFLLIGGRRLVM
jgi:hypothetical protein